MIILVLFEYLLSGPHFQSATMVLCLSKIDLVKGNIANNHQLHETQWLVTFSVFNGNVMNVDDCVGCTRQEFLRLNQNKSRNIFENLLFVVCCVKNMYAINIRCACICSHLFFFFSTHSFIQWHAHC